MATSIATGSEATMNAPPIFPLVKATEAAIAALLAELPQRFGDRVAPRRPCASSTATP